MKTVLLLIASNIFMTIAWYWHLKFREMALWSVIMITLVVFCVFSIFYLKEPIKWNYIVGFVFMVIAVFFVFKKWP
jgi:hypothetical protein